MNNINSIPIKKNCQVCKIAKAPQQKLSCCAQCKQVWYCSITCQSKDWKQGHSKICLPVTPATGPSVSAVKQVGAKVLLPKEPSSWRDVVLSQPIIDKVIKEVVTTYVNHYLKQDYGRKTPKELIPLLHERFRNALVKRSPSLVGSPDVRSSQNTALSQLVKEEGRGFTSLVDRIIQDGYLETALVPDLQLRLDNAKKNRIFHLESAKVTNQAVDDLQAFVRSQPSTREQEEYFQLKLLPTLARERCRMAESNDDPDAREFGRLRLQGGGLYDPFTTPLDIAYNPYNARIAGLVQAAKDGSSRGGCGAGTQYQEWTPRQMKDNCIVDHPRESTQDLFVAEQLGSEEVERERTTFSLQEKIEIVTGLRLPSLQPSEKHKRALRFIDLFPCTHQVRNTSSAVLGIAENQRRREDGPTKINAFTLGRDSFGLVVETGTSPVNLARFKLADPSNKSIFWMMIPDKGKQEVVYLQHSNVCESKQIMDQVVDPLFIEILQLAPHTSEVIDRIKDRVGHFIYAFAQASPYSRGSAAIAEQCEAICYKFHGLEYTRLLQADCEALTLSRKDFLEMYMGSVKVSVKGVQGAAASE